MKRRKGQTKNIVESVMRDDGRVPATKQSSPFVNRPSTLHDNTETPVDPLQYPHRKRNLDNMSKTYKKGIRKW